MSAPKEIRMLRLAILLCGLIALLFALIVIDEIANDCDAQNHCHCMADCRRAMV